MESRSNFEQLLAARGVQRPKLAVLDAIRLMADWYGGVRATDVDPVDGDMVFAQWGPSDGRRKSRCEFDLVRQFALAAEGGDDALWQLHVTLRFRSVAIPEGSTDWCNNPDAVIGWRDETTAEATALGLDGIAPHRVEIWLDSAG